MKRFVFYPEVEDVRRDGMAGSRFDLGKCALVGSRCRIFPDGPEKRFRPVVLDGWSRGIRGPRGEFV